MTAEKREVYPLSWPENWPRTRPQDQKTMASWKKTANQYRDALATELERMGSPSAVISTNVHREVPIADLVPAEQLSWHPRGKKVLVFSFEDDLRELMFEEIRPGVYADWSDPREQLGLS